MLIYIITLLFISIPAILELFHIKIKLVQKKIYYWTIVGVLILIAGLRYGLEQDYWHYYRVFNGSVEVSSQEIGFKIFNYLIHIFTNNYGIYCFIVASISMGIKSIYFEKFRYPFVILLCYYLRFYVLFELNAIRQGLAMAFVIAAMYSLSKNKTKNYFILTGIGILFHTSAICSLFALVVRKKSFNLLTILIAYFGCLIFRLFFFDAIIESFSPYISYVLGSNNNLIHGMQYIINSGDKMQAINYFSFIRIIIPGVCLYFISNNEKNRVYYNLYFIGSMLNLLFWGLDTIAFRIPAVFYIFEGYILNDSLLKNKIFGKRKKDIFFTVCFLCIAFCDIWTFCSYLMESASLVPYRSILFI